MAYKPGKYDKLAKQRKDWKVIGFVVGSAHFPHIAIPIIEDKDGRWFFVNNPDVDKKDEIVNLDGNLKKLDILGTGRVLLKKPMKYSIRSL